jgi:hypothetical protein
LCSGQAKNRKEHPRRWRLILFAMVAATVHAISHSNTGLWKHHIQQEIPSGSGRRHSVSFQKSGSCTGGNQRSTGPVDLWA